MRRQWTLHDRTDRVVLVPRGEVRPDEWARAGSPGWARTMARVWFAGLADEPHLKRTLGEITDVLLLGRGGRRRGARELLADIGTLLHQGRLIALRESQRTWFAASVRRELAPDSPPIAPPEPAPEEEKKPWIEIKLIGDDGTGIAGERYRVTLPNGSLKEGNLDQEGFTRIECSQQGMCNVCFPNLDREAWERI